MWSLTRTALLSYRTPPLLSESFAKRSTGQLQHHGAARILESQGTIISTSGIVGVSDHSCRKFPLVIQDLEARTTAPIARTQCLLSCTMNRGMRSTIEHDFIQVRRRQFCSLASKTFSRFCR